MNNIYDNKNVSSIINIKNLELLKAIVEHVQLNQLYINREEPRRYQRTKVFNLARYTFIHLFSILCVTLVFFHCYLWI